MNDMGDEIKRYFGERGKDREILYLRRLDERMRLANGVLRKIRESRDIDDSKRRNFLNRSCTKEEFYGHSEESVESFYRPRPTLDRRICYIPDRTGEVFNQIDRINEKVESGESDDERYQIFTLEDFYMGRGRVPVGRMMMKRICDWFENIVHLRQMTESEYNFIVENTPEEVVVKLREIVVKEDEWYTRDRSPTESEVDEVWFPLVRRIGFGRMLRSARGH